MSETIVTPAPMRRANKLTAHFENGVIIGSFYKTHDRLATVRSDDVAVLTSGFVMPESVKADVEKGITAVEVSAADKMKAFRDFLIANAGAFGINYDPEDRRNDESKMPNKYTTETFGATAERVVVDRMNEIVPSVQQAVDKAVADKLLPSGSAIDMNINLGGVEVTERYKNEALKYATATVNVDIGLAGKSIQTSIKVGLVSGQLKKPSAMGDGAFTMTGLKTLLVEAGLIPKPAKADTKDEEGAAADAKPPKGKKAKTGELAPAAPAQPTGGEVPAV